MGTQQAKATSHDAMLDEGRRERSSRSMKYVENPDGAVAILVALLMVVFIGVTAFVIDFGVVFVTNKDLQEGTCDKT